MREGFYKVTTSLHEYTLQIIHYDTTYTIKYGNPLYRVELTYDTLHPSVIKLDSIEYKATCSDVNELIKGEGTRNMLQSILKVCIQQFPEIKRVAFHDVAMFTCGGNDHKQVNLSYYSLLLYGQTWYERHFGAVAKDKAIRNKLNAFRQWLRQAPEKKHSNLFGFDKHDHQYASWHAYFQKMKEKTGCLFFYDHRLTIERAAKVKLMYSEWYITASSILAYDVEYRVNKIRALENAHSGGRGRIQKLTEEDAI